MAQRKQKSEAGKKANRNASRAHTRARTHCACDDGLPLRYQLPPTLVATTKEWVIFRRRSRVTFRRRLTVQKVVAAVDAANSKVTIRKKKGEPLEVFTDKLIPGVGVTVDTTGNVKIEPTTLTNKIGHKVGKWLKKKF